MNTLIIRNINPDSLSLKSQIEKYTFTRRNIFHSKSDTPIPSNLIINAENHMPDRLKLQKFFWEIIGEEWKDIEPLSATGTFHDLFCISTIRDKYVLKISRLKSLYTDFALMKDVVIQKKIASLEIVKSSIVCADLTRSILNKDFLLMHRINDKNLSELDGGDADVYESFGRLLRRIHNIKVEGCGNISIDGLMNNEIKGENGDWVSFFHIRLEEHVSEAFRSGLLSARERTKIKKLFGRLSQGVISENLSLLHNDPSKRNIFSNKRTVTSIIDWEDSIIGDALWDVAFFHTFLFRTIDEDDFRAFCRGYGFKLTKSNHLRYWLYFLRICIIKMIANTRFAKYYHKGKEMEKSRIDMAIGELSNYE